MGSLGTVVGWPLFMSLIVITASIWGVLTGEWRGIDALWDAATLWLREWDHMRLQAERFIEIGDQVLVLARARGIGKRSGAPLDHVEAEVFSFRDGRIVRWEAHWDPVAAMRSVGLEE